MTRGVRIGIVSATQRALPPLRGALAAAWPDADAVSLIDEALETDRAQDPRAGFEWRLARLLAHVLAEGARGVLFTCSAFPDEIAQLAASAPVPVHRPDDALYDALAAEARPARVLLTFPPAAAAAAAQLALRGLTGRVAVEVLDDARAAAMAGDEARHDACIAAAADRASEPLIALGQYSMTGAAALAKPAPGRRIVTGPDTAVAALRRAVEGRP